MKHAAMCLIGMAMGILGMTSHAGEDPAGVILGNDGKFNGATGICLLLDGGAASNIGECVNFIQTYVVSPPACGDTHLHTDGLSCGDPGDL